MAAWITITVDDLNDYQVGAQVDALRTAALAEGQADPFDKILADVTSRIRAEVQANPANKISATANSIPPSLKWVACWLIIATMQTRLPGLALTEEQKDQINDARKYLERVSKGLPIETPDDPIGATVQSGGSIQVATSASRLTGRSNLAGL